MKVQILYTIITVIAFISCHQSYDHKTVICIPVYGQSLALGEEAIRITNFDSLANYADGRIVTENMDHNYGYFDNNDIKRLAKRMLHYQKRSFELTVYSMAEMLADHTGNDTLICIFPGGQGTTDIAHLGKGTEPYQEFVECIQMAYSKAKERGWDFVVPALCWMQGESDVTDYPCTDFRQLFLQFAEDLNNDVKLITGQKQDIEIISYQTNCVTRGERFNALAYNCPETRVPTELMEMVRDSDRIHPSGPTYPYSFVREAIHIDAIGHQLHGRLVALSALDILHNRRKVRGLLPTKLECRDKEVVIMLNIPHPPLAFDTTLVSKVKNYGFSIINHKNQDITQQVLLQDNKIRILCSEQPVDCRVRYAINGEQGKSGRLHGPRGNLRDSQGDSLTTTIEGKIYPLHNWCWQFDLPLKD